MTEDVAVYFETYEIGRIAIDNDGGLSFSYDPRWSEAQGAFPISVTMPLGHRVFPDRILRPWIANLLPEEQQMAALERTLGIAKGDALGLLMAIGGDTAGALSFGEPSDRKKWAWEPLADYYGVDGREDALGRHFADLRERPFLAGEEGIRLSLAGGQEKTALAVLDADGRPKLGLPEDGDVLALPKDGAPSTIIIKPDNDRLPGIVENEAYCLALATEIGLDTAEAHIHPVGKRSALIVARYDRSIRADGSIRRRHQEDFAQALSIFPSQKYERGSVAGPSISDIMSVGSRAYQERFETDTGLEPVERLKVLDRLIFSILVGDTDAHAKNYSCLIEQSISFAPMYDVQSVLGWQFINQYHAQNIVGKKRKPVDVAPRHWDAISRDVQLNPHQVRRRVQELIDAIVMNGYRAADRVAAMPGAVSDVVYMVRDQIEQHALRIAGRFKEDRGEAHPAASTPMGANGNLFVGND